MPTRKMQRFPSPAVAARDHLQIYRPSRMPTTKLRPMSLHHRWSPHAPDSFVNRDSLPTAVRSMPWPAATAGEGSFSFSPWRLGALAANPRGKNPHGTPQSPLSLRPLRPLRFDCVFQALLVSPSPRNSSCLRVFAVKIGHVVISAPAAPAAV